jgi:UDP-glucose 4-epimerase
MSKRVLMTGATGFIGSHVLDLLLDNDFDITIIKRSVSNTERIERQLSRLVYFDLDNVALERVFEDARFDIVIHLATLYTKEDFGVDLDEMYKVNVDFPKKLLKLAIDNKVKKFINTSTYFQYSPQQLPISEANDLLPFNEYAKTKIVFAQYLEASAAHIKAIDLIIFSPYGPRDNDKLVAHVVKKVIQRDAIDLSEGLQKIDLTYVKDIAFAYLKAIKFLDKGANGYTAVCIASGFPVSVRELVSLVEEVSDTELKKRWGDQAVKDYPVVFGDTTKAKAVLDWSATTNLKVGLKETIDYYEKQYSKKT